MAARTLAQFTMSSRAQTPQTSAQAHGAAARKQGCRNAPLPDSPACHPAPTVRGPAARLEFKQLHKLGQAAAPGLPPKEDVLLGALGRLRAAAHQRAA